MLDGLPELGHGAVQLGAGVGDAHAEDRGDLGVVQAGVELQRDQLALARLELRPARRARPRGAARPRRRPPGGAASTSAGSAVSAAARLRRRSSSSAALRAMPNSQARSEPRDGLEQPLLAVGALERRGGHVLGRGRGRAAAWRRRRRRRRAPTGRAPRSPACCRTSAIAVERSRCWSHPVLRPGPGIHHSLASKSRNRGAFRLFWLAHAPRCSSSSPLAGLAALAATAAAGRPPDPAPCGRR